MGDIAAFSCFPYYSKQTPLIIGFSTRWVSLLFQCSERRPAFREVLFFLVKRLKMQPSEVKALSTELRQYLFNTEYELAKKEAEKNGT